MRNEPQDQVARYFMERKGYPNAVPKSVTKVEGNPCWYYVYTLLDGTLELEVEWSGQQWSTRVTTFSSA